MEKYEKIAQELGVSLKQIDTVLTLTAEDPPSLYRPVSERCYGKFR